jgi:hypothetical protein
MTTYQDAYNLNIAYKKQLAAAKNYMNALVEERTQARNSRTQLENKISKLEAAYNLAADAIPTKKYPDTHEPGNSGVPDKKVDPSEYLDPKICEQKLRDQGIDDQAYIDSQCRNKPDSDANRLEAVKSASVPAWVTTSQLIDGIVPEHDRRVPKRFRNASTEQQEPYWLQTAHATFHEDL